MAAKAAIKDVGRAMDIPYGEVDRLAKLVPNKLNITLDEALADAPQLKAAINADERMKDLMAVALRLEGLSRHAINARGGRCDFSATAHRHRSAVQDQPR